jgi:signal transduction histidine kinase
VYVSDQVPQMLIGDSGRIRQIITNLVGNSIKVREKSPTLLEYGNVIPARMCYMHLFFVG